MHALAPLGRVMRLRAVSTKGSRSSLSHRHSAATRRSARRGSETGAARAVQNATSEGFDSAAARVAAEDEEARCSFSCASTGRVQSSACATAVPPESPTIGIAPGQGEEAGD